MSLAAVLSIDHLEWLLPLDGRGKVVVIEI